MPSDILSFFKLSLVNNLVCPSVIIFALLEQCLFFRSQRLRFTQIQEEISTGDVVRYCIRMYLPDQEIDAFS
jgi:hypothetical protein